MRHVAFWYRSEASGFLCEGPDEEQVRSQAYAWQDGMNALREPDAEEYDVVIEELPDDEADALKALYESEVEDMTIDDLFIEEEEEEPLYV